MNKWRCFGSISFQLCIYKSNTHRSKSTWARINVGVTCFCKKNTDRLKLCTKSDWLVYRSLWGFFCSLTHLQPSDHQHRLKYSGLLLSSVVVVFVSIQLVRLLVTFGSRVTLKPEDSSQSEGSSCRIHCASTWAFKYRERQLNHLLSPFTWATFINPF